MDRTTSLQKAAEAKQRERAEDATAARKRLAAELKEAFTRNGGTEDEWQRRGEAMVLQRIEADTVATTDAARQRNAARYR